MTRIILIGAPVDSGQRRPGCLMGPPAYRVAGLARAIALEGHEVEDRGDVTATPLAAVPCANPAVDQMTETVGWTMALKVAVEDALKDGGLPVIMGAIIPWRLARSPERPPGPQRRRDRSSSSGWMHIRISTRR